MWYLNGWESNHRVWWFYMVPLIDDMISWTAPCKYADIRHEAEIVEWAIGQLTGALDGEATFTASNFTVQASTRCSLKRMYPSEMFNTNLIFQTMSLQVVSGKLYQFDLVLEHDAASAKEWILGLTFIKKLLKIPHTIIHVRLTSSLLLKGVEFRKAQHKNAT